MTDAKSAAAADDDDDETSKYSISSLQPQM